MMVLFDRSTCSGRWPWGAKVLTRRPTPWASFSRQPLKAADLLGGPSKALIVHMNTAVRRKFKIDDRHPDEYSRF